MLRYQGVTRIPIKRHKAPSSCLLPYRGEAPAVTDLLGGQVQVVFATAGSVIQYIRAGSLRALGISTAARLDALPEVPSLMTFLPKYEASAWGGLGAPHGTPVEIIGTLNREVNAALEDPRIKAQLVEMGATVLMGSPADFGRFIALETDKWGKVVKATGAKAE
jgi:tripartite-type tricarboxylate transporter receptor subunit TctC